MPHASVPGKRATRVWEVKATTKALAELAGHLVAQGIQRVVLEATSDYWRPFFYMLEAAGLSVWLVNAKQVKNVPGRPKTDKLDAIWLAKLAERQMLSPSFVPAEPMRHVRDLARARFDLVDDSRRVKQRVEKLLEDALVKISSVLTDVHGASGRAIMEALIAGERDPKALAELAKGRARARLADLAEACDGRFTEHHARLARLLLGQLDDLGARITSLTTLLDDAITALPQPATTPEADAKTGEIGLARLHLGSRAHLSLTRWRAGLGSCRDRRDRPRHGRLWHPRQAVLLGQGVAPHRPVRPQDQPGRHRPRQPLPESGARPDGRRRGQDRHLLGRALPPPHQTHAQGQSPGRHRALHTRHHLPPARRPERHLHRPRGRLLRQAHRHARRTDHLVHQLEALGHRVTLSPAA